MTSLPTPLLFILSPLAAAIITLIPGRWPRIQSGVGLLLVGFLALWAESVPVGVSSTGTAFASDTWLLLGRPFTVTPGLREFWVFLIGGLGLLFFLSFFFPQGRWFVPASLAALSPLGAALTIQLFTFGMLLLVMAIAFLVMTYRPVVWQTTSGGLRILLFFVLAVPLMLFGGWLFDSGQAAQFSSQITGVLVFAFALLMAGFPLYIWVLPVVVEAPFLVPALIFGLGQTAVITFIFSLLQANPWLSQEAGFQLWLQGSAIGTVLVAMLLIITARSWRAFVGYLLLLNMGMAILTLTITGPQAWETAVLAHFTRFLSLVLIGVGLSLRANQQPSDIIQDSRGLGRQAPFTIVLLILACFSLLGMPLTIGFPAQIAILTSINQGANLLFPLLLLIGLAGGAYGVLRVIRILFQTGVASEKEQEKRQLRAVLALVFLLFFTLALFPQPLLNYTSRLAEALPG